jgi:hypothetical protein
MGKLAGVKKALDMAKEARLKRAKAFDEGWFHGSTHDIDAFGGATHNTEGHFGAGHYLTNSADDASRHYAGEGPDLTRRIQLRAEQLEHEMGLPYDHPDVVARARSELKGDNEGVVYPLRTRTENVYDISADGDTFLEAEFPEYDPKDFLDEAGGDLDLAQDLANEARYEHEPEGALIDFIESLRNSPEIDDSGALFDRLSEYVYEGGISGKRLDAIMRDTEWYAYGPEGSLDNNEVYRRAIENAGFDSIVHDANIFTGMDVGWRDKHKIVFDPSRIRSVNAAFDPAKKDSADLLASMAGAGILAGGALAPGEAEASFAGLAARNADEIALALAVKMEDAGVAAKEIWQKTGWGRGADGKWRFEINDSQAHYGYGKAKAAHEESWETEDVPRREQVLVDTQGNIDLKAQRGYEDTLLLAGAAGGVALTDFAARRAAKKGQWADIKQAIYNAPGFVLDSLELPMKGWHGLTGVAAGLATGKGLHGALNQGANVARQPIDVTAQQYGDAVYEATNSPALGTAAYTATLMGDVF